MHGTWLFCPLFLLLAFQATAQWADYPDMALEREATFQHERIKNVQALVVNGRVGAYARCPTPEAWERFKNVRVELKVRLDERRGGSVPFSWPGAFQVYFNGQGIPWVLLETDHGRMTLASDEPVPLDEWLDIAFEYRADDFCLLFVNGRSVASLPGRGPLKQGGDELWFGRYSWNDEGQERNFWMNGAVTAPEVTLLPEDDRFAIDTTGLANAMNVSWGDAIVIGEGWRKLNRPEHAAPFVEECKRLGVKKVFMRYSSEFIMQFCKRAAMDEDHWYTKALEAVEGDPRKAIIDACHAQGIKVYVYHTIFDEGSPPEVLYGGTTPFPWQSRFTIEHPEYLMESHDGTQRHWGVLCYAYPEARAHTVEVFRYLLSLADFDGLYVCTRTHSEPAKAADQFGYNAPVAEEYERRYGIDIRTEPFSKSRWRELLGESLTQLLRDIRHAFPDKEVVLAMPRSDYLGAPYGNMRLDWRTWCQERLVDALVLNVTSGTWLYPDIRVKEGYIQSQQENVAMRPLEYDLGQWWGSPCHKSGVELYLQRSSIASDKDRELLKSPAMRGFMVTF